MNFMQELRNFSIAHIARNSEEAIEVALHELHEKITDEVHDLVTNSIEGLREFLVPMMRASSTPASTPPSPPVAPPPASETPTATPVAQDAPIASVEDAEQTSQTTDEDHV